MTHLNCSTARQSLSAYHDGELAVERQIAVATHVARCEACATEARALAAIGDALRLLVPPPGDREDLAGLGARVVGRFKAERDRSLPVRMAGLFEDLHLVWAALGAVGATAACVAMVLGLLTFASRAHPDSLAAVLGALATPGSNENPLRAVGDGDRVLLPRAHPDAAIAAAIGQTRDGAVLALAAVVTREGRLTNVELLTALDHTAYGDARDDGHTLPALLDRVSRVRFEPAQMAGAPVAINMVWLVTYTTVRGTLRPGARDCGCTLRSRESTVNSSVTPTHVRAGVSRPRFV